MMMLLPIAAGVSLLACGGSFVLMRALGREERMAARLASVKPSGDEPLAARGARMGFLPVITAIGMALARSGLLSTGTLAQLEQTLTTAGLRGANGLGLFVGFKLLLAGLFPAMAWFGLGWFGFSPLVHNVGTAAAAIIGLLAPDYFVRNRRSAYLRRLSAGMPDALDMMVICSEAGLGLEPAITRVAAEIIHAHPAVGAELAQTASELRVAADRRTALQNMGTRTGLDGLKRLGVTLVQTLHYGTPLADALRVLSAEMRGEMLVAFEEKAARLPVLLTVPMIVFILPTVFIIVGGPAILSVMSASHK